MKGDYDKANKNQVIDLFGKETVSITSCFEMNCLIDVAFKVLL